MRKRVRSRRADRQAPDVALRQRLSRRRLLAAGGLLAIAQAAGPACDYGGRERSSPLTSQPTASGVPKYGGTLSLRFVNNPPLDPITNLTYLAQWFAGYVYSRLLKFKVGTDPAFSSNYFVEEDLAESLEVTPDGLTWIFRLRPNVRFHTIPPVNGRPLDSLDVTLTLERFRKEPKNANRAAFGSERNPIVDWAATPDAQTVIIKLARPYAPFRSLVANPQYLWVQPKEVVQGKVDPNEERGVIGSGPFIFESRQTDVFLRVRRNPDYFVTGRPYVDGVNILIIKDNAQELAQLQARRLDYGLVDFENLENFRRTNPDARIWKFLPTLMPFIFFQLRDPNTPFRDDRVRKAVSMAFDRQALLKAYWGGEGEFHNQVPASMGRWWLDPRGKGMGEDGRWWRFDLKEAKALLAAAGFPNGFQTKYIYTNNAYGTHFNQWAESVAGMLREVGIVPTIVVQDYSREYIAPGGTFTGGFDSGMVFALQTAWTDAHDYLFNTLHSASERNHAGVRDAELNQLIDRAATILDEDERVKAVHELQRVHAKKMYYVPGCIGPDHAVTQPWVKNFQRSATYGWGTETAAILWIDKSP